MLANNFYGPDEEPAKIYLTRMFTPIIQTLVNVSENTLKKRMDHLKYLFLNVEGISVANLLRILGYWEAFGYKKYIRFSSSLRIELLIGVEPDLSEKFYV